MGHRDNGNEKQADSNNDCDGAVCCLTFEGQAASLSILREHQLQNYSILSNITTTNCLPNLQFIFQTNVFVVNDSSGWLTDVFSTYGNRTTQLSDKLLGVQPDLNNVVEQSKERGKWEGGHKQRHKAKLDDWEREQKNKCQFVGCD